MEELNISLVNWYSVAQRLYARITRNQKETAALNLTNASNILNMVSL